jgi:hypothetical protein
MNKARTILYELERWFEEHREHLASRGLSVSLSRSPDDGRNKSSLCLDIDSDVRLGQLLLWDSGEVELQIADVTSGEVVQEHFEVNSRAELEALLQGILDRSW